MSFEEFPGLASRGWNEMKESSPEEQAAFHAKNKKVADQMSSSTSEKDYVADVGQTLNNVVCCIFS